EVTDAASLARFKVLVKTGAGATREEFLMTGIPEAGPEVPVWHCEKCDGWHRTERCPHFQKEREKHKDAWVGSPKATSADLLIVNYGNCHEMGRSGGNFVLRPVSVSGMPERSDANWHGDTLKDVLMDEEGDQPPMPEDSQDPPEPADPLREEAPLPSPPDGPQEHAMRGADEVWHRMIEEATDVGVKNLTFVELLGSRSVSEVMPALVLRLHCDRARDLVAAPVRRWTLDRGIITTLTSRSSYKSNGRMESEVGSTKRGIKTLISAGLCPSEYWPLAARHIGERRLRNQLKGVGWPASPMLRFGSKAFALRKSWQERYTDWRDAREEVVVMGPDKFSSLTTTSYYVKSLATGKFFYTDDVVQPAADAPQELSEESQAIYLEELGDRASPPMWSGTPTRRLRGKTTVPAISMVSVEGEDKGASSSSADVVRSRAAVGVMGAAKPARRAQHLRLLVVSELRSWLGCRDGTWQLNLQLQLGGVWSALPESPSQALLSDDIASEEKIRSGSCESVVLCRAGGCDVASRAAIALTHAESKADVSGQSWAPGYKGRRRKGPQGQKKVAAAERLHLAGLPNERPAKRQAGTSEKRLDGRLCCAAAEL
ncbi:unnamed protein product, partial [Cladocopium goreaui]